ncbi:MAG: phosphatidylinositol-specific phospholipase C domain-containing protein, partial [Chloroflexota bacterium]
SDWMSDLSDNVLISELNIPGSHCAAAINTWTKTPYACHNYSITDQLKYGIRLLDVRLYISQDGDTFKFITCHGDISIFGLHKYQSLSSLLDECKAYLGDHRRETVLISLQVDDWSNTSNEGAALTALHDLLSDYPTTAQKSIPKLGDIRGKIFLYNRINNDLNLGTPIKWVHNTVGSYADSSSSRSYKIYVQDRYKGLDERDVDKEKFDLVKDAFLHKKNGEVVWNFASATWCVILGVYIMNKLLNYFGANPAPDRLATFGWTLFDYSFNHYPTDTYGDMNIVELIISSNSNPRYKKYNKEFKVIE